MEICTLDNLFTKFLNDKQVETIFKPRTDNQVFFKKILLDVSAEKYRQVFAMKQGPYHSIENKQRGPSSQNVSFHAYRITYVITIVTASQLHFRANLAVRSQ